MLSGCGPSKEQLENFKADMQRVDSLAAEYDRSKKKFTDIFDDEAKHGAQFVAFLPLLAFYDQSLNNLSEAVQSIRVDGMPDGVLTAHKAVTKELASIQNHRLLTNEELRQVREEFKWDQLAKQIDAITLIHGAEKINVILENTQPKFWNLLSKMAVPATDEKITSRNEYYVTLHHKIAVFFESSQKYHGISSGHFGVSKNNSPASGNGGSVQSMAAFLDKYEKTVTALEKVDWSRVGVTQMARVAVAQTEMAAELDRMQRAGFEMTPNDLVRYSQLTERLLVVMEKAQTATR
jgi:hypothetical protein